VIHRFGDVEIDEASREVRRGGESITPPGKVLDVLLYLIRHRDRVVSRAELLDQFWPDPDVAESAMNMCVARVRRVLGTSATIRALVRRGFRFESRSADYASSDSHEGASVPSRPPLIGRASETARLFAAVGGLVSGHGGIVLISGEPGVGKTRVAEELVRESRARGVEVLAAACRENAPPLSPWGEIICAYVRARSTADIRAFAGDLRHDLARWFPSIRKQLGVRSIPAIADASEARARLHDAVSGFLRRAGAQRPIAVFVDDLQSADATSLSLFQVTARALRNDRVLICCTYREMVGDPGPALAAATDAMRRETRTQHLTLHPLDADAARSLLHQFSKGAARNDDASAILAKAEGNPLLIREYWRHQSSRTGPGALPSQTPGADIPATLDVLVEARLGALSASCQEVVESAAVLGRELDYDGLRDVCQLAEDQLFDALDEAVRQRIVLPVRGAHDRYRFSHALIADAVYARLDEVKRRALHHRVGQSLERRFAHDLGAHLSQLSHHFLRAAESGNVEKAISYATRAGEHAQSMHSYDEAIAQFRQALELLDQYRPALRSHRYDLLLQLGDAYRDAGDAVRAAATYGEAEAGLIDGGAGKRESAPPTWFGTRLGFYLRLQEESLAGESWFDVSRRRKRQAEFALERARSSDDPRALLKALASSRWAAFGPRFVHQRLRLSTELVEMATLHGDPHLLQESRLFRISDLLERGRIGAAGTLIDEFTRATERDPQPLYLWVCAYLRAMRAQLDGALAVAERLAQDALQIGATVVPEAAQHVFGMQLATIRAVQGRQLEAADLVDVLYQQAPEKPVLQVVLIGIRCLQGRTDEARASLRSLAAGGFSAIQREQVVWVDCLIGLVQPSIMLGEQECAAEIYDLLSPLADIHVLGGLACTYVGAMAGFLGALAAALRRWDEASRHFELALTRDTRMGAHAAVAHTQCEFARALLAQPRPDRQRASELLRLAAHTANRLELPGLARAVESLRGGRS
jgi:DNA-binding winged helix-turn-helix (wHTH) protein/tetratricopeptide (TPR) repeat protein